MPKGFFNFSCLSIEEIHETVIATADNDCKVLKKPDRFDDRLSRHLRRKAADVHSVAQFVEAESTNHVVYNYQIFFLARCSPSSATESNLVLI
jgi:hypothetical protein